MNLIATILIILGISTFTGRASEPERIAIIQVETGDFARSHTLLSIDLDELTDLEAEELTLLRIPERSRRETGSRVVPVQLSTTDGRRLYWQLEQEEASRTLVYELVRVSKAPPAGGVNLVEEDGSWLFSRNGSPVMRYQAATVFPPEGEDEAYKRSGFVHPLYAPDGTVLTGIQPADHMHHYGIWNPWTKTTFRGEEVDFWNLKKMQGTVKHAGVERHEQGAVFATLEVNHQHIAWPESTLSVVAMNERHIMRVVPSAPGTYWVEFEFRLTPAEAITLEEYRYGGFVFRATEAWNRYTSDFITSEGLDRDAADGERARWCMVDGETPGGRAGILFMGHPQNFNHPQPLRVWPSDANKGNGDVFINFSPTRNTSWVLSKDQTYVLRYRLLVFEGTLPNSQAEEYWQDYVNPAVVHVEKL